MAAKATAAGLCLLASIGASADLPQGFRGILIPINPEINRIVNPTPSLAFFYEKLSDLKAAKGGQAVVFHIGDSHVEAGFFPGVIRAGLQQTFGDGGRGYVKPTVIGVYPKKKLIAITLRQDVKAIRLKVGLKDTDPAKGFNGMIFYHEKGFEYHDFEVLDDANRLLATVKSGRPQDWPGMGGVQTTNVELPGTYRSVVLRSAADPQRKGQRYAQLYGVSLENGDSGVVYHGYGINGANCDTFLKSSFFHKQLERVQPDLVVISLGTNDASTPAFRRADFAARLDALLSKVRETSPQSAILLTTAPDSYFARLRRREAKPNPNMALVREIIIETAIRRGCAYWDLFSIMGGPNSMKLWRDSTLAHTDNIHFTKDGYEQQGRLLLDALLKGYESNAETRSR